MRLPLGVTLTALSASNIALTALLHWYVLVRLGPGEETDALYAGMAVPQAILAIVSGSLLHVLVPLFATQEGISRRRTAWTIFTIAGATFTLVAVTLAVLAPTWVRLLVPGFSEDGLKVAVRLVYPQLIGLLLTGLGGVLAAVCYAAERFIRAELASLLGSLAAFGMVVLAMPRAGIDVAAWATALRPALTVGLLLSSLGGFVRPSLREPSVRLTWKRMRPLLLGTSYTKSLPILADRLLGSLGPAGSVSLLTLGMQVWDFGLRVLYRVIALRMLAPASRLAESENWPSFTRFYHVRLALMTVACGVAYLVLALAGQAMLTVIFRRGDFPPDQVQRLWLISMALIGYLVGGAGAQVLAGAFYATGNTTTPPRVTACVVTLGLALKALGYRAYGVVGIAVGTSVYCIANAVLLYALLERETKSAWLRRHASPSRFS